MGAKSGDKDLYGCCVDDPVNRLDVWGLEEDWWDGPGGRIIRSGLKTAGSWAVKGAALGLPVEGAGAGIGALTGGMLGLPYGLAEGTIWEIVNGGKQPQESEAERQSDNAREHSDILKR